MHLSILHVIRSAEPSTGGTATVALFLAREQSSLGYGVCLAAENVPDNLWAPPSMKVARVPPSRIRCHPRAHQILVESLASADIVHLHGIWDRVLIRTARLARLMHKPYVVAPHGMLDPWCLQQKPWKKRLALALGYRRMLNRASGLHLLNPDERRLIEPLRLSAPCAVVPNGISLADIDPLPPRDLFAIGRSELAGDPYILFLGRLHKKKGLECLTEAFSRLSFRFPRVHLVICGPDDGARAECEQQVVRLGMTTRIHFIGPLYGRDKVSALAGASCFCLPSHQEGFSIAILEALACRVPVVISENCHFPDVAAVGAGFVVQLNVKQVSESLARVLGDPATARAMGDAGRRLVEERYTWHRAAELSIEMYQDILGRSSHGAALCR
jgi:glycosyltransferase involved in cell wall biosynthesis